MIKTEGLLKTPVEDLLTEGLRPATLTEGSELFLHGFDEDEFPDTLVCPYCGKVLVGAFDGQGAFRKSCDCELYSKEIKVRDRYAKTVAKLTRELDELNAQAKKFATGLVKGNTLQFVDARKYSLKKELEELECFQPIETN